MSTPDSSGRVTAGSSDRRGRSLAGPQAPGLGAGSGGIFPGESRAHASPRAAASRSSAQPPAGLYIHIPFCVSVCPYCDFVVYAGSAARGPHNRIAAFLGALRVELQLRADRLDRAFGPPAVAAEAPGPPRGRPRAPTRPYLETVYLGGGTPSLLPAGAVAELLALVRARYGLDPEAEVSLELNPGPDERGDLAGFISAGVTRVSIGAQSFKASELKRLGRRHNPGDIAAAVALARSAGAGSINLDLLYDVPRQTLGSWTASLDAALDLAPDHLSLYALGLDDPDEEGLVGVLGDHLSVSPGARRWRERARPAQDEDRAAAQYGYADGLLERLGYRGYELSNWARPGHECRHNLAYWQRRPYEGVGPGSHAFDGQTRRWNAARLDGYVAALTPPDRSAPRLPPGGSERIDAATAAAETLILGLRLDTGAPTEVAIEPRYAEAFAWALSNGLVAESGGRVRLTLRGRLLSNELFARLI